MTRRRRPRDTIVHVAFDAQTLNAWFDRLPRLWFDVGSRRVPAFRSLGIIGFHLALLVAIATALRTGVALVTTVGLSAVAGLSFFAWGLLRRALTGHEALVLIEYVWVAYGAVAAFAWASGGGIAPALDVYSVAVAPFLAFGRLGCTVAGCCHGFPSSIGLRYGSDHGVAARFVGRRLFPVQFLEAIALFALSVVGFGLATRTPGTATAWFLSSYAVVRFGFERFRCDERPTLLRLPVPKSMCVIQFAAAIVVSETWLVEGPPRRAFVVGCVALGLAGLAGLGLVASRSRNPLLRDDHLDETWAIVLSSKRSSSETLTPDVPVVAATTAGMTVAISGDGYGLHVSLTHPEHDTLGVALALGGDGPVEIRGVTHFRIRDVDIDTLTDPLDEAARSTNPTNVVIPRSGAAKHGQREPELGYFDASVGG